MPTTGQLYFGTDGNAADLRFFAGDAGSTPTAVATPNRRFSDIAVDPATGLFFAIVNNGAAGGNAFLVRGLLSNPASTTVVADYTNGAATDSIVFALSLDTVNRRIFVGVQDGDGSLATPSGIHQYTYTQAGVVTDGNFLVTTATSNKGPEFGLPIFAPFDFAYDPTNNTLLFTETILGIDAASSSTGLFRLNLSNPTVITQVVSQVQFPDSTTNNWLVDVDVDVSTHLAYFTTQGPTSTPTGNYNSAFNGIWFVSDTATNATATQLTLLNANSTNFYSTHPNFFPGEMTFDQNSRQIYVSSEELGAITGTNDDTIYVFQLNGAGNSATLVSQFTPTNTAVAGNIYGLSFNNLPSLAATINATAALEQGALTALTTTQTASDVGGGFLTGTTIQITGGTFNTNESSFNDDHLTLGAIGATSGTVAGTNISWTYTQATGLLTLSGYDTLTNYQSAIGAVRYYATGDNPTNFGLNTSRTLTIILNDGSLNVPANSTNTTTITRTITGINDAPIFANLNSDTVSTTEPAGTGSALPAVKIDAGGNVTITDVDNANFNGGTLRFAITTGLVAGQDQLTIDTAPATTVTVSSGTVSVGGTAIGSVTGGGAGGGDLLVTFTGGATPALVQTLIRAINFTNTGGDNPTAGARTITVTLDDGGGVANSGTNTAAATLTVNVNAVDDAPTAVADNASGTESATFNFGVVGNDTDPDGGPKAINNLNGTANPTVGQIITLASGATVALRADGGVDYNPNGAFNYLISTATAAATGASNTSAADSFTYALNGGSATTVSVTVNGVDGPGSELRGTAGVDTIVGTSGADTIRTFNSDDTLRGGLGADVLDGGAGIDTADYSDNFGAVFVNLATGRGYANADQGDTYIGIENVLGTIYNDGLIGDPGNNVLNGGDGNDYLNGGLGADTLIGGNGTDTAAYEGTDDGIFVNLLTGLGFSNSAQGDTYSGIENVIGGNGADTIIGDGGANVLNGGAGDDTLIGGLGADTLIGGIGIDTASYADNQGAVRVDLLNNIGTGAAAQGDTYASIENVTGTAYQDILIGDNGANRLDGAAGNDILIGGNGADTLVGGAGADSFRYLGGETGLDRILDFTPGSDTIFLAAANFTQTGTLTFQSGAGAVATTANSTFLYDTTTGIVSYDADGNGAGAAVQLAQLNTGLTLSLADFLFG